ncbi:UvrD-helicase domain-containing protein [Ornithinimicrobium murale]|uniref:UvrD-helicase domain-containing protein n=1 Tax=Ornithinimicrobium murale TaxID=1050153 RepID=UPI000E0DD42B|nr:UvrD-helicase domain-containing protein [Ornithinimicrobium murale]
MIQDRWSGKGRGGSEWELTRTGDGFDLRQDTVTVQIPAREAARIVVERRWWRTRVTITGAGVNGREQLGGLTKRQGQALTSTINDALLQALEMWRDGVDGTIADARRDLVWITGETIAALMAGRPDDTAVDLTARCSDLARYDAHIVRSRLDVANEKIAAASIATYRTFFDKVEASPLTEEQAQAVVAYDNRVQVIAAAGSGKTSVMVARAAYAVKRGLARPDQILLLAFNVDATAELQARISERFAAASLPSEGLKVSTFHAFGLSVIGQATGRKPTIAPWVVNGQDLAVLAQIVDDLRKQDAAFGLDWDIFRLLFARAGNDFSQELVPDAWDAAQRVAGLKTYRGDIVRSHGERLIADWLFLHGVAYDYERPYVHDTVDQDHSQYRPDFFYPHIDTWHEHWGVDAHGKPPPTWTGYEASMAWKRQVHQEHGTQLLETTWAGVMAGTDLSKLGDELRKRGVALKWDPERITRSSVKPVTDADLLRLIRVFMTHVKSNDLSRADIDHRLKQDGAGTQRAQRFVQLYWRIHDAWQERLASAGCVDFEDLLLEATAHLEAGRYTSPYTLVMVDEFQDVSRARARLTKSLLRGSSRHLLAVGDDWQSINRFAGADLSVMTGLHDYFGPGPTLRLTTTFRNHPAVAETAARFITKNPVQLFKQVFSAHPHVLSPSAHEGVQVRWVSSTAEVPAAITEFLADVDHSVRAGAVSAGRGGRIAVDVLASIHR